MFWESGLWRPIGLNDIDGRRRNPPELTYSTALAYHLLQECKCLMVSIGLFKRYHSIDELHNKAGVKESILDIISYIITNKFPIT